MLSGVINDIFKTKVIPIVSELTTSIKEIKKEVEKTNKLLEEIRDQLKNAKRHQ